MYLKMRSQDPRNSESVMKQVNTQVFIGPHIGPTAAVGVEIL